MTKINKLGKSTFVIAILSFILVAVLAFGGTYAYFSASTKTASSQMTIGHLKISTQTAFDGTALTKQAIVVPNQNVISNNQGKVTVSVDSNINYFIRANITYSVKLADEATHTAEDSCADKAVEVLLITPSTDLVDGAGWIAGLDTAGATTANAGKGEDTYTYVAEIEDNKTGWYYYNKAWAPVDGAVAGSTESIREHSFTITAQINPEVGKQSSQHFMDAEITITVYFEVIQADYIVGDGTAAADGTYTAAQLQRAWETADLGTSPIPA